LPESIIFGTMIGVMICGLQRSDQLSSPPTPHDIITMSNLIIRPSTEADGDAILSIMDANVHWLQKIGSTQWGTELFSTSPPGAEYWRRLGGAGVLQGRKRKGPSWSMRGCGWDLGQKRKWLPMEGRDVTQSLGSKSWSCVSIEV
jgi:hypothetical protein